MSDQEAVVVSDVSASASVPEAKAGTQVIEYGVTDAALAELKAKWAPVLAAGALKLDDRAGYELVKSGVTELRTIRINIEKRRKDLKADALEWGRKVDAEAARITAEIEALEEPLKAAKQAVDDEKERIKREAEEAERVRVETLTRKINQMATAGNLIINKPAAYIEEVIARLDAVQITEEEFGDMRNTAAMTKAESLQALRDALEARRAFEAEQAALEEQREAQRKAQAEEDARLEQQREAQRREIAEQAERIQQEKERLAEQQREIDAQKEAIRVQQEAAERAERDRLAAEQRERERKEQEEREAAEKAERDRLAALEAERLEAARPDREKLVQHLQKCIDELPTMSTEIGNEMAHGCVLSLHAILTTVNNYQGA